MLNSHVSIYVPTTVKGNVKADDAMIERVTKDVKVKLAGWFGGFTATPGVGGWVSKEHGLIEERVTIVTAFTDEPTLKRMLPKVRALARKVCRTMEQEAVSMQVNNGLEFVQA